MTHPGRAPARNLLLTLAAIGLVGAAWHAGASGAAPAPAPAAAPTVVAIADFKRVYEALKETEDRASRLSAMQAKYQEELNNLATQLEGLKADINNAKPGSIERRDAVIKFNEADVVARAKKEGYATRLTLTAGDNTRSIYQKFLGTLDYMAKQQGWDVVLLDDRAIPIPDPAGNDQVSETITQRGVLYVGPKADVTGQVVDQMNNDYAASPLIDRTPPVPAPAAPPVAKQ